MSKEALRTTLETLLGADTLQHMRVDSVGPTRAPGGKGTFDEGKVKRDKGGKFSKQEGRNKMMQLKSADEFKSLEEFDNYMNKFMVDKYGERVNSQTAEEFLRDTPKEDRERVTAELIMTVSAGLEIRNKLQDRLSHSAPDGVTFDAPLEFKDVLHFGVKGMKWGVRRGVEVVGSTDLHTGGRGEQSRGGTFVSNKSKAPNERDITRSAQATMAVRESILGPKGPLATGEIRKLNEKYKGKDLFLPDNKEKYDSDAAAILEKHAMKAAPKGTTARVIFVGDRMELLVGSKKFINDVAKDMATDAAMLTAIDQMAHAAPEGERLTFTVVRDDLGQITDFKSPGEIKHSEDQIVHFGIKGMRWGIRRSDKELAANRAKKDDDDDTEEGPKKGFISADADRLVKTLNKESHEMSDEEIKKANNRAEAIRKYNEHFGPDANRALKERVEAMELQKKYAQLNAELHPSKLKKIGRLIARSSGAFAQVQRLDELTGGNLSKELKKTFADAFNTSGKSKTPAPSKPNTKNGPRVVVNQNPSKKGKGPTETVFNVTNLGAQQTTYGDPSILALPPGRD